MIDGKRQSLLFIAIAVLSGCAAAEAQQPPTESSAVGRFAYHPPSGEMPAVLLDTVTGCLEVIEIWELEEPDKGRLFMRKYADNSLGQWDMSKEEPQEIPGTTPPQRCPTERGQPL